MSSSEFVSEDERRVSQFLESMADSEKMGPYADELSATIQECLKILPEELDDDWLEDVAGGISRPAWKPPEKFV